MYNETTRLVKVVMPVDTEEDIQQGETNPILASVNPTRAAGDSGAIMLSETAENLFIAYEVVAIVKDESTGKTHFSQLKWKKLGELETDGGGEKSVADPSGDGEQIGVKGAMRSDDDTSDDEPQLVYQFMFESGDLFVAAAADEYPVLDGDDLQMLSDDSSSGGGGDSILPPLSDANLGDVPMCLEGDGVKTMDWMPGMPPAANANAGDVLTVVTNTDVGTGTVTKEAAWLPPSGGGVLVVHESATTEDGTTTYTLDATYADIAAAGFCVLDAEDDGIHTIRPLYGYGYDNGLYIVAFGSNEEDVYMTASENGYPAYTTNK